MKPRIDLRQIATGPMSDLDVMATTWQHATMAEWERYAQDHGGSVGRYIEGLRPGQVQILPGGRVMASVELVGMFPNMLEQGLGPGGVGSAWGPFDIRTFVLKSGTSSLRYDKNGAMYVNIPFGHTEASIAQHTPADGMSSKRVVAMAKALRPTISKPGPSGTFNTQWGGRMPEGTVHKLQPHHATDPLAGMVRMRSAYSKAVQTKYSTWRRLSWASKPWIHPGIQPWGIVAKVVETNHAIVDMVFAP